MNIFYAIRTFFRGVRNIIRWMPVIYRDRDWDDGYLMTMIYYKLKYMEEFWRSDQTHCIDSKVQEVVEQIMIAKNLAKRINEGMYICNALIPHERVYGEHQLEFERLPNGFSRMVDNETPEEKASLHQCYGHAHYMEQQDWNMLWTILKEHMREWWD